MGKKGKRTRRVKVNQTPRKKLAKGKKGTGWLDAGVLKKGFQGVVKGM